jgi:hypothetical protein
MPDIRAGERKRWSDKKPSDFTDMQDLREAVSDTALNLKRALDSGYFFGCVIWLRCKAPAAEFG